MQKSVIDVQKEMISYEIFETKLMLFIQIKELL